MLLQVVCCKIKFKMSVPCKGIAKIYTFLRINDDVRNAKTMSILWRCKNEGFITRHKLKAETFFRKTEFFIDVQLLSLTQLLSFVVFHLKSCEQDILKKYLIWVLEIQYREWKWCVDYLNRFWENSVKNWYSYGHLRFCTFWPCQQDVSEST